MRLMSLNQMSTTYTCSLSFSAPTRNTVAGGQLGISPPVLPPLTLPRS